MAKMLPRRSRCRSHTIAAIAFLVLPVLVVARAVADTLPFTVDGNPSGRDVAVSAKSSTEVVLNLLRTTTKGAPDTVDLTLSQFTDESGRPVDVALIVGKGPTAAKAVEHRGLKLSGPLIPLRLTIPELPTQGKYTAVLVVSSGEYDPAVWRIVLNPPGGGRPAMLEVYPRTVTVLLQCLNRCRSEDGPDFSVSLRDKTGAWPLDRITVRQEQGTAGFDLGNLGFWFNGVRSGLPGATPPGTTKTATGSAAGAAPAWIAPRGDAAIIGIALRDLPAGEHTATLRFQAANSLDDDGQKLALTVRVRHSMLWAFAILLGALVISFVTTKVLVTIRQRAAFLGRVRDLRRGWLEQMAPVLPVVWVRDVLHQSEALSRRFWLTGQDRIDARLGQISGLLGVLERVYQLQREFMRHTLLDFVKVRALTALTRIVGDLEDTSLSEPQVIQIKTRLDALGEWIDATKQVGYYWADLSAAIDQLLVRVKPSGLSAPAQTVIGALVRELDQKKASPPKDLKAMIDVEETYARLKILWERRAAPEFLELLELQQRPAGLEDLFEVADKAAWGRLKADVPTIVLAQPSSAATVEEYDILRFELKPDRTVADSYVFRHGLVCKWAFEVQRKLSWTRRLLGRAVRPPDRFSGESREPAVVAYAHRAGTLTVSAVVENPATGDTFEVHPCYVNVEKSTEFRKGKLFEGAEMTSFAIAGVIAMVSGLSLLYAKNATFGSLSDYLGLFLWGVGVDQGKNLVQSLKS